MKSRLAVSLLFILIASSFAPDAAAAFKKFRSWAGNVCANQAHVVETVSTDSKTVAFKAPEPVVCRLVSCSYHNQAYEVITTAARQMHEVLGMIRIK